MGQQDFAAADQSAPDTIPVIDVQPLREGGDIKSVAEALHAAATGMGFFYVTGHEIPAARTEAAFAVARDFFALPDVDKRTIEIGTDQRGWMATGLSKLEGAKTHDLKEVFFWGREVAADDPDIAAGLPLVAPNRWPDKVLPRLREDLIPYYHDVCRLGAQLMSAVSVALGVKQDAFDAAYVRPLARGQLVYYPPSAERDEAEHRFGVAPHTDFGALTLLAQDDTGGLQVRGPDGDWIEAPPIPGTLVCNIGDLLKVWSNGRLASTVHRVINRSGRERYSIPVFWDPRSDAVIDPCDLGVAAADRQFEPITAGAHISGRNRQSFGQYR
ncbi:MAG: 2-oxoglutarate and iron-dependent oxygenase domain-containing protein [Pseudomonadota bacterium]